MLEEEKKHYWLKTVCAIIITFIVAFLAFYCALEVMLHRLTDPVYNTRRIEKMIKQQEKHIERMGEGMLDNPFEPRIRPMIVNLEKENNMYKVIVDLKPLNGNEDAVNVNYENKILSVNGEIDKNVRGNEKIVSFLQSYYLDENLDMSNMTREKKGDKYIITIPFGE